MGTYCGKGPHDRFKKFRYTNFLVAIFACDDICKKGDRGKGYQTNPLHVYHCENCGGIHIGHLGSEESILMMEGYAINIRELQGLGQRVPPDVGE